MVGAGLCLAAATAMPLAAMLHHAAAERACRSCASSATAAASRSTPARSRTIKPMGPWLNVMDETFHLHLRTRPYRARLWAVRKPTKDGHVTSVEAYDADGEMIIQFFGKRHEGEDEREDWRFLAENLPRAATMAEVRSDDGRQAFSKRAACALSWPARCWPRHAAAAAAKDDGAFHDAVAARRHRRLDHRDRLCAGRGEAAGRARFDQHLSARRR